MCRCMEARFKDRMNKCKTEAEMTEYLLKCIPTLREYSEPGNIKRKDIYDKYMNDVEDSPQPQKLADYNHIPCPKCNGMYTLVHDERESIDSCNKCGYTEYVQNLGLDFKSMEHMTVHVHYAYKRENHFNEWISQFQAKESTSVPPEVMEQLKSELKKQKITVLADITHEKVKGLLKKLGHAKYYEHVPYIATMISGIEPPMMSAALEAKLRKLFQLIQEPFERHKPANRKNFLSYSFTLYKLCQLLDEDSYLPCFPLLKSKEKLYIQDQIWKNICQDLQFEFIPTC